MQKTQTQGQVVSRGPLIHKCPLFSLHIGQTLKPTHRNRFPSPATCPSAADWAVYTSPSAEPGPVANAARKFFDYTIVFVKMQEKTIY